MSASAAQFRFAAEFVSFLAAAAGLSLVALRADPAGRKLTYRVALGLGFAALATGAFLHGASLTDDGNGAVEGLRMAGLALLALGSLAWVSRSRAALWIGLLLTAVAVGADAAAHPGLADAGLVAGAVAIGVALVSASRRSLAARVAASAAGTLLLLVLVLSIALSAVVSDSARTPALRVLPAQAETEPVPAQRTPGDTLANRPAGAATVRARHGNQLINANP